MTLSDYFKKFGRDGLRKLATKAETTDDYLIQLIYSTTRLPSMNLSNRLVAASGGSLTLKGLANPKKQLVGRKGRSGRRSKSC